MMPQPDVVELLIWLVTVALYAAIPVAAFVLLRRMVGRRTRD